jgi:hypothetical protein
MLGAMNGPQRQPRRRFLRHSVRGLLAAVLVTGAGLGWIVRSAAIQRDAVAVIKRSGGHVEYSSSRLIPQWLVEQFGVDYFSHVVRVVLFAPVPITPHQLHAVNQLDQLEKLLIPGEGITDTTLRQLRAQPALRTLSLESTAVSDAGLAHLRRFKSLRYLSLEDTNSSDDSRNCVRAPDPGYHRRGRNSSKGSATGKH